MKRYDLIEYPACGTYDKMMDERPDGDWCSFEEVQALLRAVADEVKGMEHGDDCPVAAQEWRHMHEDGPMPRWDECNCPRGKVLAMLGVEND